MHSGAQFQYFPTGEIRIKHWLIRQEPDYPRYRDSILKAIHTMNPHGATACLQDPHEQAEKRRLARTIRLQHSANLTMWHGPCHLFESGLQSKALRHSFDLY